MTDIERQRAREKFRYAPQPFIGAIGAIDCTYINIKGPVEHEEAYVNHWGDHALNVQVVCTSAFLWMFFVLYYYAKRN